MTFSLSLLFAIGFGYLLLLFLLAYVVEKEWIAREWARHPLVYVLSIGVYCSAWAYFGTTGLAYEYGYGFLTYYMGLSAAFLLYPFLLKPFLKITKNHSLGSLADVFAFRYRSRWAGTATTICMLLAILPLLALQIQAITDATVILAPDTNAAPVGLAFCAMMIAFTTLYGARQIHPRERHRSLIFAIAFESFFKLLMFVGLGIVAVFYVFETPEKLEQWLNGPGFILRNRLNTMPIQTWMLMSLLFIFAPLTMPHLFQALFRENRNPAHLRYATWAVPIYLFLMALPVLPIMWAGMYLGQPTNPEFYSLALGLGLESPLITILAYLGGVSAASGLLIVATLAMASMTLNHVILPIHTPKGDEDIYHWLLWTRRGLIVTIILAAYLVYMLLGQIHNLSSLGIASFVGVLQFLPGIIGTVFWSRANRKGFLTGLAAGMLIWFTSIFYPLLVDSFSLTYRLPLRFALSESAWAYATSISISINLVLFLVVSWFTETSEEEKKAARACSQDALADTKRRQLVARSSDQITEALSTALGKVSAEREVNRVLKELSLPVGEYRPFALRRMRDRIETNLSGLMGPSVAQTIVQRYLPYASDDEFGKEDINLIESQLEGYHTQLTGLAAELDNLRRYHRQTLENLPVGVCSIGSDTEVLMWNPIMTEITGVEAEDIVGSHLNSLPSQWQTLLSRFMQGLSTHAYKKELVIGSRKRWYNLHKASLPQGKKTLSEGTVILVEDQTEIQMLEDELVHTERLASIGSLAAGVAHEIGNPVTGIDCLAQDLLYESDSPMVKEAAEHIREQTRRVTQIVQSLVNYAHAGSTTGKSEHIAHSLYMIVHEAIKLLELSKKSRDVEFINNVPQHVEVICDPHRLSQVFINLLNNARDASEPGSYVAVNLHEPENNHFVTVEVLDRGSGINPEHLDHIFEPFFTTKDVGKGTGLGLWIAYSIVEEHYGQIQVESPAFKVEGIGTSVIITLPKANRPSNPEEQL
ncbi:sensor histidine kinase [Gynuella sp.]|uniref:sensor histidine kinase n=1 Tax=Gynuella sp. TaxID=2969146 RepID=UPI003D134C5A